MKSLVISFTVLLMLIAAGITVHVATLDGLDGLIWSRMFEEDTVYAPSYSTRGFRQVETGMSQQDVMTLIGAPLDVWTNKNETVGMRWSKSPGSTHYRCRVVQFGNGNVVDKHAEFYVD